jgi:hypothetical protein
MCYIKNVMTLLDIYKRLPRIDCRECPAKTCMAFAVKLLKKEHATSECPKLNEQAKKEIDAMLPVCRTGRSDIGDWKEKRLGELFKEISQINFSVIAEGIGATNEKDLLQIKYMNSEVTVSHSDFKDELGILDKLLILMYIKKAGGSPLSGKWIAFRDLKDGLIRARSFNEICEVPLARMFGKNREEFLNRFIVMGAEKATGFSAEHSFVIHPLPKIPFLVLLWHGDEDFESDCKVLLDSTATEFLDVEALLYLGQALLRALKT